MTKFRPIAEVIKSQDLTKESARAMYVGNGNEHIARAKQTELRAKMSAKKPGLLAAAVRVWNSL